MMQLIGVGASVVGDMSSRPNWGLNELDFVFSTLVVCPWPMLSLQLCDQHQGIMIHTHKG